MKGRIRKHIQKMAEAGPDLTGDALYRNLHNADATSDASGSYLDRLAKKEVRQQSNVTVPAQGGSGATAFSSDNEKTPTTIDEASEWLQQAIDRCEGTIGANEGLRDSDVLC